MDACGAMDLNASLPRATDPDSFLARTMDVDSGWRAHREPGPGCRNENRAGNRIENGSTAAAAGCNGIGRPIVDET